MAVPKVRADYDQLKAAAGQFGGQADAVASTLQALQRDLTVLEGGDWLGAGATAFYQEMGGQVLPTLKRLARALEAAQQTTVQINQVMAQAEAEAARWLRGEGEGQNGALGGAAAAAVGASALFSNGAGGTGGPAGTGGAGGTAAPGGAGGGATAKPAPAGAPTAAQTLAAENAAVDRMLAQFTPEVRAMVKQSPTLRDQILRLDKVKYTIQAGPPNSGFSTDRAKKLINIAQPASDEFTVSLIAHEVGHGVDNLKWKPSKPRMYREEYVPERVAFEMLGEGRAQLNAMQARAEISAAGGPDIGIPAAKEAAFQKVYDDFTANKINRAQAVQQMADLQRTEHPSVGGYATYHDMYTGHFNMIWDTDYDDPVMLPKRPLTP